jgi:hypothetical protein
MFRALVLPEVNLHGTRNREASCRALPPDAAHMNSHTEASGLIIRAQNGKHR